LRKFLRGAAIAAVGAGLLSCAPRPPAAAEPLPPPVAYAPSSPVVHAPLPPPAGYLPPPDSYAPPPTGYAPPPAYGEQAERQQYGAPPPRQYGAPPPQTDPAQLGWRASPRWATVKRQPSTGAVKKDPQAKFKAAQAKAEKLGVHTLTEQDIAGLTPAQITQIRGY
jgi:hypothetical protein